MAKNIGSLAVFLTADTKKYNKGMSKAQRQMAKFSKAVKVGALAAGTALVALGIKSLKMYQVQIDAEKKLASVLKTTGYAAGFSLKELKTYASGLQDITGVGDEVILNTQAIIATFKNIKGDAFKEATEAALDMSAVVGTDLKGSAIQLGKALNDPIKGMAALSRVGVSFTDQQREQIKVMQESGDLLGAQQIILKELKGEFGGTAAALVNPWKLMNGSLGDLMESLGNLATEILGIKDGAGAGLLDWVKDLTATINKNAFEWGFAFRSIFIEIKSAFLSGIEVGKLFFTTIGKWTMNIVKSVIGAFQHMGRGYVNLSNTLFAGAKDLGLLFVDLGKQIWNAITFDDTDFKGIFERFGKNLKAEATRQLRIKPIEFGFEGSTQDFAKFANTIADLQDERDRSLSTLQEESRKRVLMAVDEENRKKVDGVKNVAKLEEQAIARQNQQRVSKALVRGTVAASQAVQQARLDAQILDANKQTANNTQRLVDIMAKAQPQQLQVVKAV